jgi:hypothetical protein
MSIGIVELLLVFGVVLALAVIDLMGTKRGVTSMKAEPEAKADASPIPRNAPAKPRSRKPRPAGS